MGKKQGIQLFARSIQSFDMFSENVNFKFDKGKIKYSTILGGFTSIFLICIILFFSCQRAVQMMRYVDSDIRKDVQHNFYNEDFQFGSDKTPEFTLAFALASFYEEDKSEIDDYG